jgi:hypothetical protein
MPCGPACFTVQSAPSTAFWTGLKRKWGPAATIVSTGGLAGRITGACSHRIIRDDNLLLKGLGILYRKNRPTKGRSPKNNAAEEKPRA